ncbi:hypothetical protein PENARI_c103G02020, partial [Penicillium arizonense]
TVTDRLDLLLKCHLYHDNYGSDHRATFSEWILDTKRNTNAKPRKAFDRVDWEKIGMEVLSLMGKQGELHSAEALDATVEKLTTTKASAVEKHTPDLRPSPYAKQCFTADLKSYQNEV